jgi:hypothetical protein
LSGQVLELAAADDLIGLKSEEKIIPEEGLLFQNQMRIARLLLALKDARESRNFLPVNYGIRLKLQVPALQGSKKWHLHRTFFPLFSGYCAKIGLMCEDWC